MGYKRWKRSTTLGGVSNTIIAGRSSDSGELNDFATEAGRIKISDRLVGSKADEAFDIYARPSTAIVPGRTKGFQRWKCIYYG